MDFEINWRTIVDINPLRELKYPSYIMSLTCSLLANSQWIKLFDSRTNSFKYFWPYFDGMTIWRGNFFLNFLKCCWFCILFFCSELTCFYSSTTYSWVFLLDQWKATAVSECLISACHICRQFFFSNVFTKLIIIISFFLSPNNLRCC